MSWEDWLVNNGHTENSIMKDRLPDTGWEDWLVNNGHIKGPSVNDRLLEMVVNSYDIKKKSRKLDIADRKHFVVLWWKKNQDTFYLYKTMTSLAQLIGFDHATVNHYEKHRKKSRDYEMNTSCIKDFLE